MNSIIRSAIGAELPALQVTRDEVKWGITHKEMGWLESLVRDDDNREKGCLKDGESLLHVCARNNEAEDICETLIKTGYNIDATDRYGHTPLYAAIAAGNYEICEVLLNLGANVDHQDFNLNTPLHKAIAENNIDIIKLLLLSGADVNKRNKYSETPLMLASDEEHMNKRPMSIRLELLKFLIDNGGEY